MSIQLKKRGRMVSWVLISLLFMITSSTYAKAPHHHKTSSKTGAIVGWSAAGVGGVAIVGGAVKATVDSVDEDWSLMSVR